MSTSSCDINNPAYNPSRPDSARRGSGKHDFEFYKFDGTHDKKECGYSFEEIEPGFFEVIIFMQKDADIVNAYDDLCIQLVEDALIPGSIQKIIIT